MTSGMITIRGARQHNLKNIDLDLPRNRLVVITGLSGSGKSSLAFDTLYAEGQRRYVESLSTYARQFLERLEKPDVDLIEGLAPAIAIEQKSAGHNPRSTVGTVTEIYDYLRLLFARVGTAHCHLCGQAITSQALDQMLDRLMALPEGTRIVIYAPMVEGRKGSHEQLLGRLRKDGFARIRVDGQVLELDMVQRLDPKKRHTVEVVVDRLVIRETVRNRLADSLELAMALADGLVMVAPEAEEMMIFSEKSACPKCSVSYAPFTPASFSFNSPQGACPHCNGLGATSEFDPALVIPDPERSLRDGAVALWANRSSVHFAEFLEALTRHYGVDIYTPYGELPERFKTVLLYGSGKEKISFFFERGGQRHTYEKVYDGLIPKLQRRYLETDSSQAREEIKHYMNFRPCPECHGARLNLASRSVRVDGRTLSQFTAFSVAEAVQVFSHLTLAGKQALIADRLRREILDRLGFLKNVGLGYLSLDRSAATLSGGESQRIRLATQIGSKLTGVLYVLDEPSIGLHQRDNQRLLETLMKMRDLGNTVLVVEHDEETIRASDHVVDMGPGAGVRGGEVVFSGPPELLCIDKQSLTGQYLSGRRRIDRPEHRRRGDGRQIVIRGATANNLKAIDAIFPIGCFICVTGVSGSGKSTLVLETLYRVLAQRLNQARVPAGPYRSIEGIDFVDRVIHIDQSPIGKTPRSNPVTYTGLFTPIRDLFSKTAEARARGYRPGRFSFNVRGGRCEACQGDGIVKIEMHFLPDVYVPCDVCRGMRYNRETLDIRYRGKTIVDVLDMTVNQSLAFFERIPAIRPKLQTLVEVGLGYLGLGQPATTLSGGEAQRVKLARELGKREAGRTIYILDEPTTGLHMEDIHKLLTVLERLVATGNTVVVIEHHLDVIKSADYVIDLGPEGGDDGGRIVACGTPEEIVAEPLSHTGRYLAPLLG
ncbi:MAG: excinuclease ABC subunit UvrA [Desulfobacterales bacterium]|nr:excinuclease ABC subunit UvrA [Desulfobacterales bacterium]